MTVGANAKLTSRHISTEISTDSEVVELPNVTTAASSSIIAVTSLTTSTTTSTTLTIYRLIGTLQLATFNLRYAIRKFSFYLTVRPDVPVANEATAKELELITDS